MLKCGNWSKVHSAKQRGHSRTALDPAWLCPPWEQALALSLHRDLVSKSLAAVAFAVEELGPPVSLDLLLILGEEDCPNGGGNKGLFKIKPLSEKRDVVVFFALGVDGILIETSSGFLVLLLAALLALSWRLELLDPQDLRSDSDSPSSALTA